MRCPWALIRLTTPAGLLLRIKKERREKEKGIGEIKMNKSMHTFALIQLSLSLEPNHRCPLSCIIAMLCIHLLSFFLPLVVSVSLLCSLFCLYLSHRKPTHTIRHAHTYINMYYSKKIEAKLHVFFLSFVSVCLSLVLLLVMSYVIRHWLIMFS